MALPWREGFHLQCFQLAILALIPRTRRCTCSCRHPVGSDYRLVAGLHGLTLRMIDVTMTEKPSHQSSLAQSLHTVHALCKRRMDTKKEIRKGMVIFRRSLRAQVTIPCYNTVLCHAQSTQDDVLTTHWTQDI